MGLSIHYSGCFKQEGSLEAMIDEVKDIAEIYEWKYSIHNIHFPERTFGIEAYDGNLYGISLTPPNCETISLTFLSNGKMCCGIKLKFFSHSENENDKKYLYMLSTKTQFAGSTIHKIIIHLFKYLSKIYFQEFQLSDEGYYWETEDESILEERFKLYSNLINEFESSLKNHPKGKAESFNDYFNRIINILEAKRNKT